VHHRHELSSVEIAELLAKPTLTITEAAAVAGLGTTNFRNSLRSGSVPVVVVAVGARRLILTAALKCWLGIDEGTAT
jgi:hypothetical protein